MPKDLNSTDMLYEVLCSATEDELALVIRAVFTWISENETISSYSTGEIVNAMHYVLPELKDVHERIKKEVASESQERLGS